MIRFKLILEVPNAEHQTEKFANCQNNVCGDWIWLCRRQNVHAAHANVLRDHVQKEIDPNQRDGDVVWRQIVWEQERKRKEEAGSRNGERGSRAPFRNAC